MVWATTSRELCEPREIASSQLPAILVGLKPLWRNMAIKSARLAATWRIGPLVASRMGITILPASAVKHSVPSVVACEILDRIPMVEIGIAVSKRFRTAVVDNFGTFVLKKLGRARYSLSADRS
jgi:hypothetical protein